MIAAMWSELLLTELKIQQLSNRVKGLGQRLAGLNFARKKDLTHAWF
jgi:hypothetical protein